MEKKCQVFEICKTSSNDIEKIHDLCIDQGKYRVYLLSPPAFSEYKACVAPACTDVTMDKSIGTIDPFSLSVQNEYIFIKVH